MIVDPSPSILVSKSISAAPGASTDLTIAKGELDALGWILGGAFVSEQGRVRFRPLYDVGTGPSWTPAQGTALALIPNEEIAEPIAIAPGFRQRVPQFAVPWGYNPATGTWTGEARGAFGPALTALGEAHVDALPRLDATTASWVADQSTANGLATRHVTSFGLGLLLWRFRTTYPHPELSLFDPITIEVSRFATYDPIAARALAGRLWATGYVMGIYDAWGTDLAIWIPTLANISATAAQTPADYPPIPPLMRSLPYSDGFFAAAGGDSAGNLASGVQKYEGTALHAMMRHAEEGIFTDGTAVTFDVPYQNAPKIMLMPHQAIVFNTSMGTAADVYLRLQAQNVTVSGFTLVAKNVKPGAITARADDFAHLNSLANQGDTAEATTANAPANDSNYTIRYSVHLTVTNAGNAPVSVNTSSIVLTVAIDSWDGATWTERDADTYSVSQTGAGIGDTTAVHNGIVNVSGLTNTDKFRVRIKTKTVTLGKYGTETLTTVHGYRNADDSASGVTYTTASDVTESATPNTGDGIKCIPIESS
jgi:hypothetical protein